MNLLEAKGRVGPVAEYKKCCIIELAGSIERYWMGKRYSTDGKAYLVYIAADSKAINGVITLKSEDVHLQEFADERAIKTYLDFIHDIAADGPMKYLSLDQMWKLMRKPNPWNHTIFEFDEVAGKFKPSTKVHDGQSRTKHYKI